METFDDEAPVHFSTGRLTRRQADVVNAWRDRLLLDQPLPGQARKGEALRLLGIDNRPAASCSDAIAAAVAELLNQATPAELELARYAYATRQAHRAAADGTGHSNDAPKYPPVSFYLPAAVAARWNELRKEARMEVMRTHAALEAQMRKRFEAGQAREASAWLSAELRALGCPPRAYAVPGGTIARMAIDRWRRRSPDRVAAAAVAHAAVAHDQPHRARQDMHKLDR